jgi:hypothetical protein
MSCVGDNYIVPGADPCNQGGGGVTSIQALTGDVLVTSNDSSIIVNTITGGLNLEQQLFIGQYYRTANEVLSSGSDNITFQAAQSWNNDNGYITINLPAQTFNVVQAGLYQVEFALTVAGNGATWTAGRSAAIAVLRGTNQSLLQQTITPPSGNGYTAQVVGTLRLNAGDIITCVHNGNNTSGSVSATGLANTFDYNTTFTWTFLKSI